MDALATALMSVRLTAPLLARLTLGGDASLSISGAGLRTGAIPFHYMLSGSCRANTGDAMIDLRAGDMLMPPATPGYRLETGRATERLDIVDLVRESHQPIWSRTDGLDAPLLLRAGDGADTAQVLSGIFTADGDRGGLTLGTLPGIIHMPDVREALGGLMRAALDLVVGERGGRRGFAATSSRLLEAILAESLRVWVLTRDHPPGLLRGLMHPAIAPLLRAIYREPGRPWTVAGMAATCGQSRSAFARDFRAAMDASPAAFVASVRCEQAERLLRDTALPVGRVASTVGYRSAFAFSRAFRAQRAMTPAAFRRQTRSGPAAAGKTGLASESLLG